MTNTGATFTTTVATLTMNEWNTLYSTPIKKPQAEAKFKKGDRVRHKLYGSGVILEVVSPIEGVIKYDICSKGLYTFITDERRYANHPFSSLEAEVYSDGVDNWI